MRKLVYTIIAMFFVLGSFAQNLPYSDNMESYTLGGYLAAQNGTWWTTWSNQPGTGEDGIIDNAHANSGNQAVRVDETGGATDLILKLGNKTTGAYELSWYMFVDNGKAGYYNIQHFQSPGIEWAFEIYFNANGSGLLTAGGQDYNFTYPKATWFLVSHTIDLDADLITLFVNGTQVAQWPFSYQASSTSGTKQLGGVDLYAGAQTGETPQYWFDDVDYSVAPTVLYFQNFDSWNPGTYVAVNDPEWFTTWSNQPGTGEDALVDNTKSHSPANSALVDMTGGATDLILKLGNKTSGHYILSWYMYVEANYAGYYNIQHFQSPGIEWAFEAYFNKNGSGTLEVGGQTINFNYPKDTWFKVEHDIDLDNDLITLYVNGVTVYQWPFSYQGSSTTGTKQLGGVDFYAGAQTGETPKYFFDDLYFAALAPPMEPNIEVAPTSINAYLIPNTTSTDQIVVSNTGSADLVGQAIVILNSDKLAPVGSGNSVSLSPGDVSAGPVLNGGAPATDATAVLHYDGDNNSAIGWSSVPVTVTVAAMFPNSMTLQYAGMNITSVDVYVNDLNTTGSNQMKIKIYGMGTTYEPGPLLYEQTFTPAGGSWEHVVLTTPVLVTGQDIWVGYQFTQSETGIYIPGCDAGPNHPYGDFLSTGVGWSHLSNNPSLPYNWNIRANLEGNPLPQWLSVAPTSFTVAPGGTQDLTVTFNATDLPIGIHEGIVRILSNDVDQPSVDVNCVLSCSVGIDEGEKVAVLVYPNPAKDRIMISSNYPVKEVRITSMTGKVMYSGNLQSIDVSKFPTGVYFIQTTTHAGVANIKFMKE
ncbi:MAG: T9SS type A sorting domain-containing protein [Bacteroidales bacterium]|jgi:hypothetical protein|nr:T9SS type A sorting domain-containing protein [Bacteroidales bacterium]NPV35453.1 T9SS type A sorting domain-containing protein [Bacteroidales bacterium]